MRISDGSYVCDRCGVSVENASIYMCSILSDIDPDQPGVPVLRHFCRSREEDGTKVKGCTGTILTKRNIEHYLEETSG